MRLEMFAEQAEKMMGKATIVRLAYDLEQEGKLTRDALIKAVDECDDWGLGLLLHWGECNGEPSTADEVVDEMVAACDYIGVAVDLGKWWETP